MAGWTLQPWITCPVFYKGGTETEVFMLPFMRPGIGEGCIGNVSVNHCVQKKPCFFFGLFIEGSWLLACDWNSHLMPGWRLPLGLAFWVELYCLQSKWQAARIEFLHQLLVYTLWPVFPTELEEQPLKHPAFSVTDLWIELNLIMQICLYPVDGSSSSECVKCRLM